MQRTQLEESSIYLAVQVECEDLEAVKHHLSQLPERLPHSRPACEIRMRSGYQTGRHGNASS